jgi:GNAT superfamily N-acetyltransferase
VTAGITVRAVLDGELDAAGELVAQAYLTEPGIEAHPRYLAEIRDARGRAADTEVLVAVDADGALLGCVSYVPGPASRFAEVERAGEAGFRMLGVLPAARGRGVGRALVEACAERARAADRRALAISTDPGWTSACRLYERLGFARTPERDHDPVPGVHLVAYVLAL